MPPSRAEPSPSDAPPVPALVDGRYEVISEVGRGGAGTAFLARDRARGGAAVALKVLRGVGPERRALLEAEVRALARIAHPAIPAVRDLGTIRVVEGGPPDATLRPGAFFLARDFVEGSDLFAATRGKPWPEVRPLAVALAAALGAVHARGLAHGDVKPGNVLVPATPAPGEPPVRLIDFGTGATVEYLAPERIRGAPASPRADLYALGATLYRVLSGELPHPGRTAGEVARAALEGSPIPLGRWPAAAAAGVPAAAGAAIMRLLERAPARRFPSAEAFLRAIGEPAGPADERAALPVSLEAAPLAGRDAERALIAAMADLAAGRPRVLVVEGGVGLGKSRLLREAALAARLRGLRVAFAAGRAGAAPFALFLEALPDLGPIAPPAAGAFEPRAPATTRALDALAGRILALAHARPLALVLDDLDRAGEEDRALAALLARRIAAARPAPPPLVIFAAARPGGAAGLEGARIALRDLPRDALPALVRGALGPVVRGEDALLDELARRAGGNPALAAAALADLARAGALAGGAGGVRFTLDRPAVAAGAAAAGTGAAGAGAADLPAPPRRGRAPLRRAGARACPRTRGARAPGGDRHGGGRGRPRPRRRARGVRAPRGRRARARNGRAARARAGRARRGGRARVVPARSLARGVPARRQRSQPRAASPPSAGASSSMRVPPQARPGRPSSRAAGARSPRSRSERRARSSSRRFRFSPAPSAGGASLRSARRSSPPGRLPRRRRGSRRRRRSGPGPAARGGLPASAAASRRFRGPPAARGGSSSSSRRPRRRAATSARRSPGSRRRAGLGFSGDGTLFAAGPDGWGGGAIYRVDKQTGAATQVRALSYEPYDMATQPYAVPEDQAGPHPSGGLALGRVHFDETFEGAARPAIRWSAANVWELGPPGCLATRAAGGYPAFCLDAVETAPIDLAGARAPVLAFRHWHDLEEGRDAGSVSILSRGGEAPLGPAAGFTGTAAGWTDAVYDLSAYAGERDVRIRFTFRSEGARAHGGWFIDRVRVADRRDAAATD